MILQKRSASSPSAAEPTISNPSFSQSISSFIPRSINGSSSTNSTLSILSPFFTFYKWQAYQNRHPVPSSPFNSNCTLSCDIIFSLRQALIIPTPFFFSSSSMLAFSIFRRILSNSFPSFLPRYLLLQYTFPHFLCTQ